jgi:hypothetical protein
VANEVMPLLCNFCCFTTICMHYWLLLCIHLPKHICVLMKASFQHEADRPNLIKKQIHKCCIIINLSWRTDLILKAKAYSFSQYAFLQTILPSRTCNVFVYCSFDGFIWIDKQNDHLIDKNYLFFVNIQTSCLNSCWNGLVIFYCCVVLKFINIAQVNLWLG